MRFRSRAVLIGGLTLGFAAAALAGPPAGHGRSFSGPISGPAPVGASGPAPVGASGNILRTPHVGGSYRSGVNRGGYSAGRSGQGDMHRGDLRTGGRHDYRRQPSALFFAPYYYPSLDYASSPYDTGEAPDEGIDPSVQTMVQSQDQLGQQVQRLTSEIEQLRSQQQVQSSPYTATREEAPETAVPITLILNSGQKLQVKNYAVMDGVFWDFTKQPVHKIRLSDVDVDASAKATQANGGEFPNVSE